MHDVNEIWKIHPIKRWHNGMVQLFDSCDWRDFWSSTQSYLITYFRCRYGINTEHWTVCTGYIYIEMFNVFRCQPIDVRNALWFPFILSDSACIVYQFNVIQKPTLIIIQGATEWNEMLYPKSIDTSDLHPKHTFKSSGSR